MRLLNRSVALVAACLATYLAGACAIYGVARTLGSGYVPQQRLPLVASLALVVPLFVVVAVGGGLVRRWRLDEAFASSAAVRVLARLVLACYAVTFVAGVPQVEVAQDERLRQGSLPGHPPLDVTYWSVSSRSWAAVPLLPFVVLNYRDARFESSHYFVGGFEVSAWYVVGVHPVLMIRVTP